MGVSLYTKNPYQTAQEASWAQSNSRGQGASAQTGSSGQNTARSPLRFGKHDAMQQYESSSKSSKLRDLLRGTDQTVKYTADGKRIYSATSQSKQNGYLDLSGTTKTSGKQEEKAKKRVNYNYKEVAGKIQQAKTSVSAGRAMISAKRKVIELKRKIANGDGDADELQIALSHAKRMEMIARKKKHNLELEEMVTATHKRDERQDEMEEASENMRSMMTDQAEQEIADAEDDILAAREETLDDITEQMEENGEELSEEMMADLNEMISEIGEEELEQLEEMMEMFEAMEVVDPHMSEDKLRELKQKHRDAENKAILKANMEYLKSTIKHETEKGVSLPGMGGSSSAFSSGPSAAALGLVATAPSAAAVAAPAIDVMA